MNYSYIELLLIISSSIATIILFRHTIKIGLNILLKSILKLTKLLLKLTNDEEDLQEMELLNVDTHKTGRSVIYHFRNVALLHHYEAFKLMFEQIQNSDEYENLLGPVIIKTNAIDELGEWSLHEKVLLDKDTDFDIFYAKIKDKIASLYNMDYSVDVIPEFKVTVWEAYNPYNTKIKITQRAGVLRIEKREMHTKAIKPLVRVASKTLPFNTMDIETVTVNNIQVPFMVTLVNDTYSEYFLINEILDVKHVKDLWDRTFDFIFTHNTLKKNIFFLHNLGSFDGIFIYKYLLETYTNNEVSSLIDFQNKIICITLKTNGCEYIFKDSLRIFPCSLNELCKVFGVEGKLNEYKKEYSNPSLLKNELLSEFIQYGLQDSKSLYLALLAGQELYFKKYKVDITSVVSIPSLALKIFRTNYLRQDIPILSRFNDTFIRQSYYGGATDIYEAYAKDLYYYDVNSLYPYAMCKPMPLNLIKTLTRAEKQNLDLNNFFGFMKVDIECPNTVMRPVLPYRINNRTIFPIGNFTGVYFSEELKAVLPLGYKIKKIHFAKEFSKGFLFNDYIDEMYKIKMVSKGPERWIAKLLQNSLYGLFGRKQEVLKTVLVRNEDLENGSIIYSTFIVKSEIRINEEYSLLIILNNVSKDMLSRVNIDLDIQSKFEHINSNVAIASAITAYARIHMIPFKIDPSTKYTDTDSIFTTKKLDNNLIGKELGLMKDELDGGIIKEAMFLGIKQYGYYYIDNNNQRVEKSVWAGITRNSLTFEEIISLKNGSSLVKTVKDRFFTSLIKLNIQMKSVKISIKFKPHKILVNNIYLPLKIDNLSQQDNLFKKILYYIKKYIKI